MEVASLGSVETRLDAAVEDLRGGGMVLLVDRGGATEAGYLVAAARTISAATIATMLRDAVGMPWLALPAARCDALGLTRIGHGPLSDGREMMVTFEASEGITTGISAEDRARTMRIAADPASTAADIAKPGHVLPVRVHPDGVLHHCSAAEAAAELAAFAALPGGATLCQAMDDDGQPATGAQLPALAARLGLHVVDTLDVLDRRLRTERLVERAGDERVVTARTGPLRCVTYRDRTTGERHFALVQGDAALPEPLRVFTHTQDPPADVFAVRGSGGPRAALERSLDALAAEGRGALLYLAPAGEAAAAHDDLGGAALAATRRAHVVTQILRDLGVRAVQTGAETPA